MIKRVTRDDLFRIKELGRPEGSFIAPHGDGTISQMWYSLEIRGDGEPLFCFGSFRDVIEGLIPFSGRRRNVTDVAEMDGIRAAKIGWDWVTEAIPADSMDRVENYTGFSVTVTGQKKRKIRVEDETNCREREE